MPYDCLPIDLPQWAVAYEGPGRILADEHARMRYAIELARLNVEHGTGGPFGAAVFTLGEGRLVAIGVNSVVRLASSIMHAEMMAIMRAQRASGTYSLKEAGLALYASCEPCAMCLGGILWSGIRRLVCGAPASAARAIGFDEGPVFPESYRHLEGSGMEIRRGLLPDEAGKAIQAYHDKDGTIYNA